MAGASVAGSTGGNSHDRSSHPPHGRRRHRRRAGLERRGRRRHDLPIRRLGAPADDGPARDQNGFFNWSRWTNAEFDAAVAKLLPEFDSQKRNAVYLHAQVIAWDARGNIDAKIRKDTQVMLDLVKVD